MVPFYPEYPTLCGKYTVFGKVIEGLDSLFKFNSIKTDKDDKPLPGQEVEIVKCGQLKFKEKSTPILIPNPKSLVKVKSEVKNEPWDPKKGGNIFKGGKTVGTELSLVKAENFGTKPKDKFEDDKKNIQLIPPNTPPLNPIDPQNYERESPTSSPSSSGSLGGSPRSTAFNGTYNLPAFVIPDPKGEMTNKERQAVLDIDGFREDGYYNGKDEPNDYYDNQAVGSYGYNNNQQSNYRNDQISSYSGNSNQQRGYRNDQISSYKGNKKSIPSNYKEPSKQLVKVSGKPKPRYSDSSYDDSNYNKVLSREVVPSDTKNDKTVNYRDSTDRDLRDTMDSRDSRDSRELSDSRDVRNPRDVRDNYRVSKDDTPPSYKHKPVAPTDFSTLYRSSARGTLRSKLSSSQRGGRGYGDYDDYDDYDNYYGRDRGGFSYSSRGRVRDYDDSYGSRRGGRGRRESRGQSGRGYRPRR